MLTATNGESRITWDPIRGLFRRVPAGHLAGYHMARCLRACDPLEPSGRAVAQDQAGGHALRAVEARVVIDPPAEQFGVPMEPSRCAHTLGPAEGVHRAPRECVGAADKDKLGSTSPSRNRSVSRARRWTEAFRLSINCELIVV